MNAIIVGADGSDHSLRAIEWAAEEAARRGLALRIVNAAAPWLYDTPIDPRLGAVRKWLLTSGEEVIAEAIAVARARDTDLDVDGEAVPGGAARALLERARDASMVVVGSHGVGTVAGLLLGSTALQVVTHAPVPTVVVRHLEPVARQEIAVGVDGSAVGEAALGFAFEEAGLRKARLRVIHVWSDPRSAGLGEMMPLVYDPGIVAEDQIRRLGESLAAWREKYPDIQVVSEVVHGRPARVLAGASARADLLAVGTRGRGGFAGLLLGSVSHGLLHHAHCPLAVVPSGP
ncbi:MAG: Universal stress protein UspA and related nucleotide-binding protein-like protein [Actinoallomurus sp.]|jgi:nucleotide-binding universal stress UspA family protein|nr:Universal stress protein UspA and related nucleotide-binding protein-like protein [Actinoallomurus sp.]